MEPPRLEASHRRRVQHIHPVAGRGERSAGGSRRLRVHLRFQSPGDAGDGGFLQEGRDQHPLPVPPEDLVGNLDHGERGRPLIPDIPFWIDLHLSQEGFEESLDFHQIASSLGGGGLLPGGVFGIPDRRHRPREGSAVDLAVAGDGKALNPVDEVRHHIARQGSSPVGPELFHRRRLSLGDQISHQLAVPGGILPRQNDPIPDAGMEPEAMADLAQLHPIAANLHLVVPAPQEGEMTVRQPGGAIPGAIHAPPGHRRCGIRKEAPGGEGRLVAIVHRQTLPANEEIPFDPQPAGFGLAIQNVIAGVVHGGAVGNAAPGRILLEDRVEIRPHRGFRGPSQIDQPGLLETSLEDPWQRQGREVPAEKNPS